MKKVVFLLAFMVVCPIVVVAQAKMMERDDFFAESARAREISNLHRYFSKTTHRTFTDGIAKVEVTETFNMIGMVLKRGDDGKFRPADIPKRTAAGTFTSKFSTEETSLDGQKVTLLTWFRAYVGDRFEEDKIFVAESGKIVREEGSGGKSVTKKLVLWDETIDHNYDTSPAIVKTPSK